MLGKYEEFMRNELHEKTGKDVSFMCFDELYKVFENVGLLEKYPYMESIKNLKNNEIMSEKGKEITFKTLYLAVTTPVAE